MKVWLALHVTSITAAITVIPGVVQMFISSVVDTLNFTNSVSSLNCGRPSVLIDCRNVSDLLLELCMLMAPSCRSCNTRMWVSSIN